ncbi:MAG: hypothetical protein WBA41_31270 [Rivularia sp. (in: cyanobacteria)]
MSNNPKVLIQNQGPLGGAVEQVTLDTNRVNIKGETSSRLANLIALSSRGLWVDCSQWLAYSAGFFSLVKLALLSPLPLWSVALAGGVPFFLFFVMIAETCDRRKSLQIDGFVRFSLIFVGGVIGAL